MSKQKTLKFLLVIKKIEEYELAIKDIWGNENIENDKKELSSFALFNNEEKEREGYIIFKDPRESKKSSNKGINYNIRELMYKRYEVKT